MAYLSAEPLRSVSAANFTNSYMPIGGTLTADALILRLYNQTNQPVLISFNGVDAADYIDSGQVWELDCTPGQNAIEAGTQIYLNGFAGPYNSGFAYLSVYHD